MITSSTLTVSVARNGGSFGVVEVQWNASVSGISHFYMSLIASLMHWYAMMYSIVDDIRYINEKLSLL